MKMKRGELVGFQGCLGYDYDVVTKSLSVNEEGAETVRYIFDRYVAGAGSTMIARELNEQGIPTIKGNPWTSSSVMGIINNEKYKGDILLGKTFTVDPISKRRLENLGEEDRFYIKNHHEAIISEETFARAQEIRERRNGGRKRELPLGKEKNSADSMHLAVCWSVDFVVRIYQGEGGIAAQNIQKLFGNVWNQRSMVKGFAQTVKEFQSRL